MKNISDLSHINKGFDFLFSCIRRKKWHKKWHDLDFPLKMSHMSHMSMGEGGAQYMCSDRAGSSGMVTLMGY